MNDEFESSVPPSEADESGANDAQSAAASGEVVEVAEHAAAIAEYEQQRQARVKPVLGLLGAQAAIVFLSAVITALDRASLQEAVASGAMFWESSYTGTVGLLGVLHIVALVASIVVWVKWLAASHIEVALVGEVPPPTGRQVFWDFAIPFLNLVRPVTRVQSSYDVIQRLGGDASGRNLAVAWWASYMVLRGFERVFLRATPETFDEMLSYFGADLAFSGGFIFVTVIAALFVRRFHAAVDSIAANTEHPRSF